MFKVACVTLVLCTFLHPQSAKENRQLHAQGSFAVTVKPTDHSPDPTIGSFSLDKQIHGDLEATSQGEMLSAGDPKAGHAGYVAMERVTGTLNGKKGSFAMMHWGTLVPGQPYELRILVVPGSGTGELAGIEGAFTVHIDSSGKHTYSFDYTLGNNP